MSAANEQGLIENNGVTYTAQEIEDWHRAEGYVRRGSAASVWQPHVGQFGSPSPWVVKS